MRRGKEAVAGIEEEKEEEMDKKGVREVCRLVHEADPDRGRGLDTLCLMGYAVTAAGVGREARGTLDVCTCALMSVY